MISMSAFMSAIKTRVTDAADITDGSDYVVVVGDTSAPRGDTLKEVHIVTAHATEHGTVEFDFGTGPIEFFTEETYVFETNAQFDGCTLAVYPKTRDTVDMYKELQHQTAARHLRQQIADVVCGLTKSTARGEMDDVRKLQSLVNDLVFHEAALNQELLVDDDPYDRGPLAVRPVTNAAPAGMVAPNMS